MPAAKRYADMTDTERALHRARQLLAQEGGNVRDLRLALADLLDTAEHLQREINYLVTGESP